MDNLKEFQSMSDGGGKTYKLIIGVLVAMLLGFGVLYFFQIRKTEKKIAELNEVNQEKETLTYQYQGLLDDYDELEVSNDTLQNQLLSQKDKIKDLLTELRSTKAENKQQISKYKKELKTLRNIMKGFIHQIDSLNTLNIQLTEENQSIKRQYYTERRKASKLTEDLESERGKVAIASVIRAIDLSIESYNHKGKFTTRAKKVKRLAVKFVLDENAIAPKGTKKVYVRFTNPENYVLIHDVQPMFTYEDEQITYSAVREIEYDGTAVEGTVYYENTGDELISGSYKVDIFCDGHMIGSTIMELN